MASLYTSAELVAKLKELDELMDSAVNSTELDTGQSRHSVKLSVQQIQRQYEKYLSLLQQIDPQTYMETFGPDVIRFGGRECR